MLTMQFQKQLTDFTLQIEQQFSCQGVTAILGVSGSGKSTLINLINGLIKPDTGRLIFQQTCLVDCQQHHFVAPEKRQIATVFQDPLLFPHLSVQQNLRYGMAAKMQPEFSAIIEVLNIAHLLTRQPAKLSGGEKQRVAIGRALLSAPKLLLMDEPLSALDMPRKKELIHYIKQLIAQQAIPVIYVTHHIHEARQLADHIAIMEQGQIIAYGPTAQLLQSQYLQEWL